MNYSIRALMDMLKSNPDLSVDDRHYQADVMNRHNGVAGWRPGEEFGMSERDLQQAVIDECDRRAITKPAYGLIFCIPNGQYRKGQRIEPGLRAGIPDLFLPVARDHPSCGAFYHGLFIELKIGDNQASAEQREWIERLRGQGYCCAIVRNSVDAVMLLLEWYLG